MTDSKQFTFKNKPITYSEAYIDLYNWKNYGQVYKIYKIIELKKMRILIAKNLHNFDTY